jgi:hypothetical protein
MLHPEQVEQFHTLKAGPVMAVAKMVGVSETQLRTWRSSDGLKFGNPSSREGGHPTYHLADAAIVLLAYQLRRRGFSQAQVPAIVNQAAPCLSLLSYMLLTALKGEPTGGNALARVMAMSPSGAPYFMRRSDPEFSAMINNVFDQSVLFFDLAAIVTRAFELLAGVLNISLRECPGYDVLLGGSKGSAAAAQAGAGARPRSDLGGDA